MGQINVDYSEIEPLPDAGVLRGTGDAYFERVEVVQSAIDQTESDWGPVTTLLTSNSMDLDGFCTAFTPLTQSMGDVVDDAGAAEAGAAEAGARLLVHGAHGGTSRRLRGSMTRRTRAAGVLASGLCAGMLLLAGCGNPEPAASSDAGQQGRDPALGGVQPLSSAPAGELLETAVANTDELMAALGGDWTFGDGAEAYDAERVREESVPEPCTARSEDSETVAGGLYSVVAETGSPEEDAGQTLERFEEALDAAGYQTAEGNGVGTSDRVTANGESEQGCVTLSRSADAVRIQLRTACSTDSSLQSTTG